MSAAKKRKAKAKAKAKATADAELPEGTREVKVREGDPAKNDPTYHERAKKHRETREARNLAWREETTAKAQEWVGTSGLDEAQGLQVMAAFNKAHQLIAQSRTDVEDGVIHPREGRDEQKWAKEDLRVELNNILGEEKTAAFLDHVATAKAGGI